MIVISYFKLLPSAFTYVDITEKKKCVSKERNSNDKGKKETKKFNLS